MNNYNIPKTDFSLYKVVFTLFLIVLSVTHGVGQEPVYTHLTEKDGLPDNRILDILQDKEGFIWLAAESGLYRFDGKSFKNYTHPEKRGLTVYRLREDHSGNVWSINVGGQVFYVENDELKIFVDVKDYMTSGLPFFEIDDENENVVISSDKGLIKVDFASKKIKEVDVSGVPATEKCTRQLYARNFCVMNDTIFFSANRSLYLIKGDYIKRVTFCTADPFVKKMDKHIFLILESKGTVLSWNSTNQMAEEIQMPEGIEVSRHMTFMKDSHGDYWITSQNGAYKCAYINHSFVLLESFLVGKFVTRVLEDSQGVFWLSTYDNGVFKVPSADIKLFEIPHNLAKTDVTAITEKDTTSIFFGTRNGTIGLYNPEGAKLEWLHKTEHELTYLAAVDHSISSLHYSKKNNILIAAKAGETISLNIGEREEKRYPYHKATKDISIINDSDILVSNYKMSFKVRQGISSKGLLRQQGIIKQLTLTDTSFHLIRKKRANTNFYNKTDSSIYIGYVDDLYYYNRGLETIVTFNGNSLFSTDIDASSDGVVWVATSNEGLFGVRKGKIIHHYNVDKGLVSNRINKVKADGTDIWMATGQGIQCLRGGTKEIITIDKNDGLPTYKISGMVIMGNRLFASSPMGLLYFDKRGQYINEYQPSINIVSFSVNEEEQPLAGHYDFSHHENSLKIGFHSISFNSNNSIKYKYRLVGLQDNWINTTADFARFTALPTGNYTFEVKAINEDGIESERSQIIKVDIVPPFWRTWWFYFLVSLFVFLSLFFLVRSRFRRMRHMDFMEKELMRSKLSALRAQMNPHFIFNALNSIQEYILTNQKRLAVNYLGKFADLMRIYLDHSRKHAVSLQEELDALHLYLELENLRFEDGLNYTVNAFEGLGNPSAIFIPTLIVQPYVENAIKHGLFHLESEKRLKVSFHKTDENDKVIVCKIKDNGIGRKNAMELNKHKMKKHMSFASKAGKDRLSLLNEGTNKGIGVNILDLHNVEGKAIGTEVVLTIPFSIL